MSILVMPRVRAADPTSSFRAASVERALRRADEGAALRARIDPTFRATSIERRLRAVDRAAALRARLNRACALDTRLRAIDRSR